MEGNSVPLFYHVCMYGINAVTLATQHAIVFGHAIYFTESSVM